MMIRKHAPLLSFQPFHVLRKPAKTLSRVGKSKHRFDWNSTLANVPSKKFFGGEDVASVASKRFGRLHRQGPSADTKRSAFQNSPSRLKRRFQKKSWL
jgi:hypothetical protein